MLAATITVRSATKASLYNLLRDATTDTGANGANVRYSKPQEGFSEIRIQAITGTQIVYIGDQNVSTTNYGAAIPAAANGIVQFGQGADTTDLNTRTIFLIAATADQVVSVWIR